MSRAGAQMPLDPALRSRLEAEGALAPVLAQLARARQLGWFAPAQAPPQLAVVDPAKQVTWRALVLLVDFSDRPQSGAFADGDYHARLFSVASQPSGSMADFYLENSAGGFLVTGDVVGWLRMPHPASWYCDGDGLPGTADDYGLGPWPRNAQGLAADAIAAADPLVDFSLYRNGRTKVDGVFVVHAGEGAEQSGRADDFWSHEYFVDVVTADGVTVGRYTMEPEMRAGQQLTDIGVFAHEFGHALGGFPDLYDLDRSSGGVGRWSLMGTGVWNGGGHTPAHYDAWCKARLGFVAPTVVTVPQLGVLLPAVEQQPSVLRIQRPAHAAGEYLLLEHRRWIGFDRQLPGEGLLVWHVDDAQAHNRDEACGPAAAHPLVRLLQADGDCDLEGGDTGDAGDPFPGATANTRLGEATAPDTRAYSGQSTRVTLEGITRLAAAMRFDVLESQPGVTRVPDDQSSLAAALAAASAGDVIRIRAGHVAAGQFQLPAGVTLSGGWDAAYQTQDAANPSVLQAATNLPVVTVDAGTDTVRLDLLIVRGGAGIEVALPTPRWVGGGLLAQGGSVRATRCSFQQNVAGPPAAQPTRGGAVAGLGAALVLEDCSFSGSQAHEGLDVYAEGGSVLLRRCDFQGGVARAASAGSPQRGGALLALDVAAATLEHCAISGYSGLQSGAGFYVRAANVRVDACELLDNAAGQTGGGAYVEGGQLEWTGGRIARNHALFGGGVQAIALAAGSRLANILLQGNVAVMAAGGAAFQGGEVTVEHCVFHGDVAAYAASALYANTAAATVRNSVFLDNGAAAAITRSGGPSLVLSHNVFWENDAVPAVVGASLSGTDRLVVPGFVAPADGDYHLLAGSALIDTGDPTGGVDFDGGPVDIGLHGGSFDDGGRPAAPPGMNVVRLGNDVVVGWSASTAGTPQAAAIVYGLPDAGTWPQLSHTLGVVAGGATQWVHVAPASMSTYRVQLIDAEGHAGGLGPPVSLGQTAAPRAPASEDLRVGPVTPNPFNPSAEATMEVPWPGRLTAQVLDPSGRRVCVLHDGWVDAGRAALRWDGRDGRGAAAASGVYLLRVELRDGPHGATRSVVRRMSLVR